MDEDHQNHKVYRWTAFPLRESPHKGVLFWIIMIMTIWAVYWNIGSVLVTAAAAILLLGSLSSFYLPTRYTIDESGVMVKRILHNRRMYWYRVRSVSDERDGVFLSTFPVKSRLENFRGLYLPYRNNRQQILELVRTYAPDVRGLPKIETDNGRDEVDEIPIDEV